MKCIIKKPSTFTKKPPKYCLSSNYVCQVCFNKHFCNNYHKQYLLECASTRGEGGIKGLEMLLCCAQVSVFN